MAEFTIEQLKTVLDNMVDSLDQTKGDEGTHAELQQIKHLIRDIKSQLAKDATNDTKENKALVKNFFEEWDRQNPLRDLRKSVDELNKKSDNPLRQGGGGGNNNNNGGGGNQAGGNPLSNMFDKQAQVSESQAKAGNKLAATLGLAVTAAGLSLNYLKEQATAYRSLMASAEGSIGSIAEMKDTAAMNGMSMQELITTMQQERNLRIIGAKDFAKWNKQIRDATLYTGQMGMTFEEIANAQDAYVETLRGAGMVHSEGINTMTQRVIELVGINQKMATLMGKTREEQLEAMKKESEDANFRGILRGMNLSPEQFAKVDQFTSTLDEAGRRLFKQAVFTGGSPTDTASAQYMTLNPEIGRAIVDQAKAFKASGSMGDPLKAAQRVGNAARLDVRDRGTDAFFGFMGQHDGANPAFAQAMAARERLLRMKEGEIVDPTSAENVKKNAGDAAVLSIEDQGRRLAAAFDDVANQGYKAAMNKFGDSLLDASKALGGFIDAIHSHARDLEGKPNQAMVEGGLMALLANAGMFAGGAGAMWGAGKLFGRGGGGAARAGAGAGAARAGGMGSKLGTAARVGGRFLGAAGGAYGMYDGYQTLAEGGTSMWDKVYGYGSSIAGGAAMGAAGGSLFAGVGAIPGALIGGVAGLGSALYSDWTHPDGAANAAGGSKVKMPSGVQNLKQAANATGGNKTNDPATMMMKLETKLLEVSTASLNQLVDIKKSHHRQLELMREDIGANKAATDRLARLLEESNRNTKQIGGLT